MQGRILIAGECGLGGRRGGGERGEVLTVDEAMVIRRVNFELGGVHCAYAFSLGRC